MVLAATTFITCSGNDNGAEGDSEGANNASISSIEGIWNMTNTTGYECGDYWNDNIPTSYKNGAYRVTFKSDGTFLAESFNESKGWYSSADYLEYSKGHYEIGDGKLYLKGIYDAEVYTIKSFGGSKMVLHTEWEDCNVPCWADLSFKKQK